MDQTEPSPQSGELQPFQAHPQDGFKISMSDGYIEIEQECVMRPDDPMVLRLHPQEGEALIRELPRFIAAGLKTLAAGC